MSRQRNARPEAPRSRRAAEKEGPRVAVERTAPRNSIRWTADKVRRLGKASDAEVARRLRVSLTVVERERRRRGIAAFRPRRRPFVWNARALALLGMASDREVAAELGVPHGTVNRKRRILGIPSFRPPPHTKSVKAWRPREEAMLGTKSDHDLARQLGCSVAAVSIRRRTLGIPAFGRVAVPVRWTKRWLRRLGKLSDAALARQMGVALITVNRKRRALGIPVGYAQGAVVFTPELRRLLREPNTVVRRRTGLKAETIRRLRAEHGIPSPPTFHDKPWTKRALARLGKIPDAKLAHELGVCTSAVRGRRLRAGIPASRPWRRFTAEERALLRSDLPVAALARRIGRTLKQAGAAREYERKRKG